MVFRAFLAASRLPVAILLMLGLAIGSLEGGFVYLMKSALAQGSRDWRPLLALAFGLVSLRSLLQWAAARLEAGAVRDWIAARRSALIHLAGTRRFPSYREPWRSPLIRALDAGFKDMAEGAAAGIRGFAALAQAAVLLPLLLLFSWRPALAAAALALPVWWLSRLRSASLAASAREFGASSEALAREVEAYAEGLESASGNGRLAASGGLLSGAEARHEDAVRRWELSKALFPPFLEWLFFAALAALLALAAPAATGAAGAAPGGSAWTGSLLPFAALLLLLYRPLREWARAHPARLPGDAAWESYRTLQDTLSALPERRAPARAPGGRIVCERIRFAYGGGSGAGGGNFRGAAGGGAREAARTVPGEAPRAVFRGLSLELDPGEATWIHGPNGSGKSTLLRLLAGVESPDGGRILLPAPLLEAPAPFAYLPQRAVIEPDWPDWAERFSRERAAEWERLDAVLGLAPLRERARGRDARAWAEALSGGQRQRLALARVFAADAPCLLLDEPTTWLSGADRERILRGLLAFRRRRPGAGMVLVSHEAFAGGLCTRALRLEDAEIPPDNRGAAGMGGRGGAEDPIAAQEAAGAVPEAPPRAAEAP